MTIPFAYAVGLAALLLARELWTVLPGSGRVLTAAAALPLLLVPAGLALLASRRRWDLTRRLLGRAGALSLPIAYLVLLLPGGYLDLADSWAGDSHAAAAVLLLLPLFAGEVARLVAETRGQGDAIGGAPLRPRLAFVGIFTAPWLVLGCAGDLLRGNRGLYAFVAGSSAGLTIGALLFVVGLGLLLPLVFRVMFGLSSRLPEPLGGELRTTAAALGFPGRAVLWLDSGMRTVNALLVGPLPWPRYLVLTDGLIAALDLHALRGVVAHEVGHAQAGHPALLAGLFVVAPLLFANAAQLFESELSGSTWAMVAAALLLLLAWRVLRRVAHRFEHEADVLSAIALGGAEPCIRALQRVGQVVQQEPERASLLHPSESDRIDVLRRFAADPQYRARFALRGLHLRRSIGVLLLLALFASLWSWYSTWTLERAALRFYVGDFAGAHAQVELVGADVPATQWEWWSSFREDLDAARAIAGDGGDWAQLRPRLAEEGWRRGIAALAEHGPAAARAWFTLATEDPERSPLRRSVLLFCQAARDGDVARMDEIRRHIAQLGCPADLWASLAR